MEKVALLATALMLTIALAGSASAFSYTGYISPLGDVADVTIPDSGIAVERLNFYTADTDGRFKLRIDKADTESEGVYEYFNIMTSGLDQSPRSAVIDFKVSKSWLQDKNIDLGSIYLSLYEDDAWKTLGTIKIGEDEDFLHFRSESMSLDGFFAVTGTPVPFEITYNRFCNGDGVCDSADGENSENCGDCLARAPLAKCVPFEDTCLGDSVMACNSDGTDYDLSPCEYGCVDGQCLRSPGIPTGMAVAGDPFFLGVVSLLVAVIAYLLFSLNGMRKRYESIERVASSQGKLIPVSKKDLE